LRMKQLFEQVPSCPRSCNPQMIQKMVAMRTTTTHLGLVLRLLARTMIMNNNLLTLTIVILILPLSPILRNIMSIVVKERDYGINPGTNIETSKTSRWASVEERNIIISLFQLILLHHFPL
jgi:hypothetical protein